MVGVIYIIGIMKIIKPHELTINKKYLFLNLISDDMINEFSDRDLPEDITPTKKKNETNFL